MNFITSWPIQSHSVSSQDARKKGFGYKTGMVAEEDTRKCDQLAQVKSQICKRKLFYCIIGAYKLMDRDF